MEIKSYLMTVMILPRKRSIYLSVGSLVHNMPHSLKFCYSQWLELFGYCFEEQTSVHTKVSLMFASASETISPLLKYTVPWLGILPVSYHARNHRRGPGILKNFDGSQEENFSGYAARIPVCVKKTHRFINYIKITIFISRVASTIDQLVLT